MAIRPPPPAGGEDPTKGRGRSLLGVASSPCRVGAVVEPGRYALVGCTVAPGFEFEDFEMPDRDELWGRFPEHRAIIERLTR